MPSPPATLNAAIAAHRFGLGEATLDAPRADPRGWLLAQIGPADAPHGGGLPGTAEAMRLVAAERTARVPARDPPAGMPAEQILAGHYREVIVGDIRSRLATAAATQRPFAERLQLFWANHFTVSLAKGSARGLVGAFEREAIRPHIAGSFEQLLVAATTHPAMLRYLDNHLSAGPGSRIVARAARRAGRLGETARITGLNENLAREVLELHTLGVDGGYTQADVSAFARVLTGWRAPLRGDGDGDGDGFDADWHEPGAKTVLGRSYREGAAALGALLRELAQHPSTARFLATKLARHFVADEPPAALVDRLASAWRTGGGRLPAVYEALVHSPEAWEPLQRKLKTPEEFVVGAARLLGLRERMFERPGAAGLALLGQRPMSAPSPAGWSDRADDWLGPEAVWKRLEWSHRIGERLGGLVDARALAVAALGPQLSTPTRVQIERAADGSQALALLLMAPEFQRR